MIIRQLICVTASLGLFACSPQIPVDAPKTLDLADEAIQISGDGPPPGPEGRCWAHDITPAQFETTTEQTLTSPEQRATDGTVTAPATYRSVSRVRVVRERRDIWFAAPCPEQIDLTFLATLQRALKARGYYAAPLTGVMDAATTEALRRYQADHGLDSPMLSLAAARKLGISTTDLPTN
jgi:hypothetical protein